MNEQLREELDYCVPLGIPHSVFLSWDSNDQDKALAYRREMAKCCSSCGTRKEEWEADKNAYIGWVTHCEGCKRLERERKNQGDEPAPGSHVGLMPRTFAEALVKQGQTGT